MLHLQAVGALDQCPAFDVPLSNAAVAAMEIPHDLVYFHAAENLRALERNDRNRELAAALRKAMVRYEAEQALTRIRKFPARNWLSLGTLFAKKAFLKLVSRHF
jgi:hypothetical protein